MLQISLKSAFSQVRLTQWPGNDPKSVKFLIILEEIL